MDWVIGMQKAIDYIEDHLTETIDYETIAAQSFSSSYHFQRVFNILCGFTVGEYIRNRRLSLAGAELATSDAKVIVLGYKRNFKGTPYDESRHKQEVDFFISTRAHQWMLKGMSNDKFSEYCVLTNMDDYGYDFYIAAATDDYERDNLYNSNVTGIDFMEQFRFEEIIIPERTYAVFETEKLLGYTPVSTTGDIVLSLREQIESLPRGEDFDFTFRMAAALHTIILSKEMTSDNMNPGWDTDEAMEHAGNAEWGYSCCSVPEITTTMRHGAVFFSNNKNLTLMNTDVRQIVSVIKPFSDAKNLKIAATLYQLTVHSEDAYATVAQISEKSGMLPEKVKDCLENELSPLVIEKDGVESQFRFDGKYMQILPIISLLDMK